jgi:acyl-homoserine-lactone acylase
MRIRSLAVAIGVWGLLSGSALAAEDIGRWKATAERVTIVRDTWGIAHVKGKTDADAVFGIAFTQAEDDFNRVEMNYLTSLGRRAEALGPGEIWSDLRQKLFIDPVELKAQYAASPPWLKALMNSWADGLNYYLATHPETRPRVITRFEPWMALSFTEGSIGGDIERIEPEGLAAFYGGVKTARLAAPMEVAFRDPPGSNGIALSPKVTRDGHALLLINPHTSFFFRSEMQVTSGEGLNVYGAATWGQFFIYQGFNDRAGWMHTSSGVDVVDEFAETIVRTPGALMYRHGPEARPVTVKPVTLA